MAGSCWLAVAMAVASWMVLAARMAAVAAALMAADGFGWLLMASACCLGNR